jgi:hydrogenase-4 component B
VPVDYLLLFTVVMAVLGALLSLIFRSSPHTSATVASVTALLMSTAGLLMALSALLGNGTYSGYQWSTVFGTFSLSLDRLGAFFLLIVSLLMVAVSIFSAGYLRSRQGRFGSGTVSFLFIWFVLSIVLLPMCGNAVLFLVLWEVMSVTSFLLVMADGRDRRSVASALTYAVMTHAGTALIMVGFILLWFYTGGTSFEFAVFQAQAAAVPGDIRSIAFLLFLIGFGTKAGMIPLHIWLPNAYAAAPASVTALLSGATMKIAILMLIRCYFDFLGVTDTWWGLLVLLVGCISALLGIMYALLETELRRVLAYSSVENAGILLIGLGASMVFQSYGLFDFAALALIAVLFHVLNHAMFKGLLFMGAGAIEMATGERDMEHLGGLVRRMPWTAGLFLIGALSISAIPPFNGFVSEWLIFQSLLLSFSFNDAVVNLLIPIAVAVLALTGALAAACFVRLFGITFLARPRGKGAAEAKEVSRPMLIGMGIVAGVCVLTGVLSTFIIPELDKVSQSLIGVSIASQVVNGWVISTPASSFSSMDPILLGVLMLFLIPVAFLLAHYIGGRKRTEAGDTWDCGTPLNPRTEYTATGLAQPINRVFSSILRPHYDTRTEYTTSRLIKRKVSFTRSIEPVFEEYIYEPIERLVLMLAQKASIIQKGSIQAYLAYIFVVLLALLVIFR